MDRYPAKSPTSLRKCTSKKYLGQTAFGFGSIPCEKPLQPLEMYPEKVQLQKAFDFGSILFEKSPQATCCDNLKKYSSRLPSALGRYPAKSLSSLRRFTPKKHSRQTASSFGSIPCEKSRQRPEMYPERTFRPDNLRLPFPTDREAPQAARCDNPKKCSFRQPSALDLY